MNPTTLTHARIAAMAGALPTIPVPSSYWDTQFHLPAGTTAQRTGIQQRFRCGPGENAHTMAAAAITRALAQAVLHPRDIGLVLECSACIQQPLPSNAACLLETLGAAWAGIPGVDVRNTCLGFLAGLHFAQALVAQYRHILIVSSETPWAGLRHDDPESAPLFGEGAAACILSWSPHARPYYYAMEVHAQHRAACEVIGGGHRLSPFACTPANHADYRFAMNGPLMHKVASRHLPGLVENFRAQWAESADLLWLPHPASGPAVELLRRRLAIPVTQFFCTIAGHGNMISAGIPFQMAAAHAAGRLSHFVTVGTAAGYSQAIMAWKDCDAP